MRERVRDVRHPHDAGGVGERGRHERGRASEVGPRYRPPDRRRESVVVESAGQGRREHADLTPPLEPRPDRRGDAARQPAEPRDGQEDAGDADPERVRRDEVHVPLLPVIAHVRLVHVAGNEVGPRHHRSQGRHAGVRVRRAGRQPPSEEGGAGGGESAATGVAGGLGVRDELGHGGRGHYRPGYRVADGVELRGGDHDGCGRSMLVGRCARWPSQREREREAIYVLCSKIIIGDSTNLVTTLCTIIL